MKSFKHWYYQEIEETFGIERNQKSEKLAAWLDVSTIDTDKREALDALRISLFDFVDSWNEIEMSHYFIGPLLNLVNVQNSKYRGFWGRSMKLKLGDETISGIADFMLAKGRQIPKSPYFFIHSDSNRSKPETGTANDPIGQLLMGMLAAQQANASTDYEQLTIYGTYIIGRNWYFVVLDGKEYAISDSFTATQADIFVIFQLLQKVKRVADVVVV